jgi:hypothetical protein
MLFLKPTFPWHNFDKPLDVVGSGNITPDDHVVAGDALAIINYINAFGAGAVPVNAAVGEPFGFLDTTNATNGSTDTGDNFVSPGDALSIINAINAGQGGEGEISAAVVASGPQPTAPPSAVAQTELDVLLLLLALDVASRPMRR